MREFKKYLHVEKLSSKSCEGILEGICHVFPKLDGENQTVWWEGDDCMRSRIGVGSRNLEVNQSTCNNGFYSFTQEPGLQDKLAKFFTLYPDLRLYGEYVKKARQIKTYDRWNTFKVFDVARDKREDEFYNLDPDKRDTEDQLVYLSYEEYKPRLDACGIDYIEPMYVGVVDDAKIVELLEVNTYMIKEGQGVGEGICIKRYEFRNNWHHAMVAKVIHGEYGKKPTVEKNLSLEETITATYLTAAMMGKERIKAKIKLPMGLEDFTNLKSILVADTIQEYLSHGGEAAFSTELLDKAVKAAMKSYFK